MAQYKLVLTQEADKDLSALYEDGFHRWGEQQADQYYSDIIDHFDLLCENPYLFRRVDEIRLGYRRSVCGKHSVYYRIIDETVKIIGLIKNENRFSDET